ncbi:type IV pilus secretin PilQ [Ramlibacter ginsenosidimutans]|uniref:Type IV pilus secretin PilQ n=1 Tax=Ramlibacter ginsenosidimutans TaxID=502333 RepID=A0A934WKJ1_9BURK|nr:type IV pilus secretin PilQ [Ramlibacter ginsenosidimutans]MBK6004670.1 type IV pilus secretin PilQ [Ramlibacter ginsenosidimutans]
MMKTNMWSWRALLAAAATLASAWVHAAPAVENITGSLQGGQEVVRVEFSEPLTSLPTGFVTQSPARIALDVPGASNSMGRNAVEMNVGNLRSVNVVQGSDRSRVVLNLKTPTNYKLQLDGKALLVSLDPVAQTAQAAAAQTPFAESRNREMQPLKDLDFRRGPDGSGRVIVDLPTNQVGVDIRQQGQTLVVDFLKSSLPEGLRRRMDVTDFGTPIQTVTTTQQGDRVRMVIEPRGAWEHSAYQSDTQFVVEVRQQKQDPNKLSQGPGYTGEKLSLNFQNIEVRSLLQVIADFTNFNIVTSDSVTGAVTLRLKDVPWDQALDIILQAKGLGMRRSGNVLWIAPKDEIAAKEKLELESNAAIQSLEPVRTQAFQMNYTKAADIAVQLTGTGSSRILSSRGSAIAEPRTNQLFVTDVPSKLEEVQQLVARLDIAVPQVLIEARIVEAQDSFGNSLGVKLGAGFPSFGVGGGGRGVVSNSYDTAVAQKNTGATSDLPFVNLPSQGAGGFPAATLGVSIFNSSLTRFLNLELSALEADGKGRLVSSPRIVTADKTKALIEQGTEFPYQQATSSGATSVSFRRATLKLEVTPQITPEGNIILDLDINKDSRGETTAAGVAIDTKHIKTQVLVDNGGTVVIGGIFTLDDASNESRVPVLGDIPVAGNLFKYRDRSTKKTELLVFITPKVVADKLGAALR